MAEYLFDISDSPAALESEREFRREQAQERKAGVQSRRRPCRLWWRRYFLGLFLPEAA